MQIPPVTTTKISVQEKNSFALYPNPAQEKINLKFEEKLAGEKTTVTIQNFMGEELVKKEIFIESLIPLEFSTEFLSEGIYFVKVSNSQGNSIQKFTCVK